MIQDGELLLEDSGEIVSAEIGAWPDGMQCARDELNWFFRPLCRVSFRLSIRCGGSTHYYRFVHDSAGDLAELDSSGFVDRQLWVLSWAGLLLPGSRVIFSGSRLVRSLDQISCVPSEPPALSGLAQSPGLELSQALGENPFGWDRVRFSEWIRETALWGPTLPG